MRFLRKIETIIYPSLESDVNFTKLIQTEIGTGDYIKISSYEFFLQDYSATEEIINIERPNNMGLNINKNKTFETLEISFD
jgi:hypothetical protein